MFKVRLLQLQYAKCRTTGQNSQAWSSNHTSLPAKDQKIQKLRFFVIEHDVSMAPSCFFNDTVWLFCVSFNHHAQETLIILPCTCSFGWEAQLTLEGGGERIKGSNHCCKEPNSRASSNCMYDSSTSCSLLSLSILICSIGFRPGHYDLLYLECINETSRR